MTLTVTPRRTGTTLRAWSSSRVNATSQYATGSNAIHKPAASPSSSCSTEYRRSCSRTRDYRDWIASPHGEAGRPVRNGLTVNGFAGAKSQLSVGSAAIH